jgi:two-component system nitrogen regulation sensor histidine kinase GlnL
VARDLRGVLDAVLAGILVLDEEGRIELVNSAACRILETSAETGQGLPVERLLGPDHSIAKLARSVLASGRAAVESERRVERRGAEPVVVDASASPLFEDGQQVSGVVLFLRDRTIQKQLEELVAERERLSAFGHIAAGIAHEVKNPLGGIRGAAEILAARADDGRLKEAAELVVREVGRIAALVDDLMVFARDDEIRFAPVNIHRVLDHVLELQRAFDPSIPELLADESRLTQVFLNLTQNAVQAMGAEGGTLTIRTRMPLAQLLSTTGEDSVPALLVTISDTGPGIAPDVMAELATPFFSTRKGGTGLGLAVSRHWVTRHGGTLRIDSTLGEGTSVQVVLPLRRAT